MEVACLGANFPCLFLFLTWRLNFSGFLTKSQITTLHHDVTSTCFLDRCYLLGALMPHKFSNWFLTRQGVWDNLTHNPHLKCQLCVDSFELFWICSVQQSWGADKLLHSGQGICMGVANRSQSVGTCTVSFRLSSLIIFWCLVHIMSWADSEDLNLPNHMLRLFSSEWELKIWDIVIYVLQKTQPVEVICFHHTKCSHLSRCTVHWTTLRVFFSDNLYRRWMVFKVFLTLAWLMIHLD